ncbi:MAG: hypothetical protein MUF21_01985, partial [Gemmatimonadaceae bacterium]|nr:hypothetical protein [Gemmatimonadaceae bacterium]
RDRPLATYEEDLDVTTATAAGTSIAAEGLATWREASLRGRASGRPSLETHGVVLGWTARRDTTQPVPPAWYEIAVSRDRGALRDAGGLTFEFANLALTPSELAPADTLAPRAVGDSAAPVTPVSRRARRPAARGPDTSADTLPPRVTVALRLADGREAQLALDEGAVVRRPLTISLYKWKWVEKRAVGDGRAHEHVLQRAEFPLERFAQALPGFDPAQVVAIRFRFDRRHAGTIFVDNVGVVAR